MEAMQPVWAFFDSLEGFEFAAFWIAAFTAAVLCGFALDYILQNQGFGPYVNTAFAAIGVFAGLYVRYNYLRGYQLQVQEPYLTLGSILGVTAVLLIGSAFLRNRFS